MTNPLTAAIDRALDQRGWLLRESESPELRDAIIAEIEAAYGAIKVEHESYAHPDADHRIRIVSEWRSA